jgi:hypothetical protein
MVFDDVLNFSAEVIDHVEDLTQEWPSEIYGVAARLGNGEKLNPVKVLNTGRCWPNPNMFYSRMDDLGDVTFFACSDTPSFVMTAVKRYGAYYQERFMLPEGAGGHPGHLTGDTIKDAETTALIMEHGVIDLYKDALVEMIALSKCHEIICSRWSGFPKYAELNGSKLWLVD